MGICQARLKLLGCFSPLGAAGNIEAAVQNNEKNSTKTFAKLVSVQPVCSSSAGCFFCFFFPFLLWYKRISRFVACIVFFVCTLFEKSVQNVQPHNGRHAGWGGGGLEINPRDSEREPVRTGSSAGANPEPSVLFVRLDGTK